MVELPDPCLVVLIGAAGSGKSTLASRLFAADEILSSDRYRALVSGDEADQAATRAAFSILHRELSRRMGSGRTTVIDATNVTAFGRRSLLRRAAPHGVPAVAIVLDLDPLLVQSRNATRSGRIVPAAAVDRQLRDLRRTLRRGDLEHEGFALVIHVRASADLDALQVSRRSPR